MADLSQNTALVLVDTTSSPQTYQGQSAGEAITIGMPVYQTNASNGYWYAARAGSNALVAGGITKLGIAYSSTAAAGQSLTVFTSGRICLGASLTVGQVYAVSTNNGKIAPYSDLTTNDFVDILGVATNSTYITTPSGGVFATNTQKP